VQDREGRPGRTPRASRSDPAGAISGVVKRWDPRSPPVGESRSSRKSESREHGSRSSWFRVAEVDRAHRGPGGNVPNLVRRKPTAADTARGRRAGETVSRRNRELKFDLPMEAAAGVVQTAKAGSRRRKAFGIVLAGASHRELVKAILASEVNARHAAHRSTTTQVEMARGNASRRELSLGVLDARGRCLRATRRTSDSGRIGSRLLQPVRREGSVLRSASTHDDSNVVLTRGRQMRSDEVGEGEYPRHARAAQAARTRLVRPSPRTPPRCTVDVSHECETVSVRVLRLRERTA